MPHIHRFRLFESAKQASRAKGKLPIRKLAAVFRNPKVELGRPTEGIRRCATPIVSRITRSKLKNSITPRVETTATAVATYRESLGKSSTVSVFTAKTKSRKSAASWETAATVEDRLSAQKAESAAMPV
jgi:hypothetical protein